MAGTQEPAEEGDPSAGSCVVWRCLAPPPTRLFGGVSKGTWNCPLHNCNALRPQNSLPERRRTHVPTLALSCPIQLIMPVASRRCGGIRCGKAIIRASDLRLHCDTHASHQKRRANRNECEPAGIDGAVSFGAALVTGAGGFRS